MKFRVALSRWIRKYRKKEVDIPPALKILKEFQQNRADQQAEIKRMRDDYTMSLLIGEGFQEDEKDDAKKEEKKEETKQAQQDAKKSKEGGGAQQSKAVNNEQPNENEAQSGASSHQ